MNFTHTYGDLFDHVESGVTAIAHGVNCQGLMGAGIAATMCTRYPAMEGFYRHVCQTRTLVPGGILPWHDAPTGHTILNCASQNQPGADAQLGWLMSSLTLAASYCALQGLQLAVPEIGCHIGGLDRDEVFNVFDNVGRFVPLTVVTYQPPKPSAFIKPPARGIHGAVEFA